MRAAASAVVVVMFDRRRVRPSTRDVRPSVYEARRLADSHALLADALLGYVDVSELPAEWLRPVDVVDVCLSEWYFRSWAKPALHRPPDDLATALVEARVIADDAAGLVYDVLLDHFGVEDLPPLLRAAVRSLAQEWSLRSWSNGPTP